MADAAENIDMTIAEFDRFVEGVAEGRKYELFDGAPVLRRTNRSSATSAHLSSSPWIDGAAEPTSAA